MTLLFWYYPFPGCGNCTSQQREKLGFPVFLQPDCCESLGVSRSDQSLLNDGSACISSVMRLVQSIRSLGAEDITYSLGLVSLWA